MYRALFVWHFPSITVLSSQCMRYFALELAVAKQTFSPTYWMILSYRLNLIFANSPRPAVALLTT